jgi:hypothetical protein
VNQGIDLIGGDAGLEMVFSQIQGLQDQLAGAPDTFDDFC